MWSAQVYRRQAESVTHLFTSEDAFTDLTVAALHERIK
jgi:hypothetical protein